MLSSLCFIYYNNTAYFQKSATVMAQLAFVLKKFLEKYCRENQNYGLAYSGGTDSKALLHLLLELIEIFPINLYVLHVDHGWREESRRQADLLEEEVRNCNLVFLREKIAPAPSKTNLEDYARQKRHSFFLKMSQAYNLQAIFLAHHAQDVAETVLQRILEGAHLHNLSGMISKKTIHSMVFLRPLLDVEKKDLSAYLEARSIEPIHDYTNENTAFLRARMRQNIFPILEKQFGKNILRNLLTISKRSTDLNCYLEEEEKKYHPQEIFGPLGVYYDCRNWELGNSFLHTYFLGKILKKHRCIFARNLLDEMVFFLEKKKANKKFIFKDSLVYVDRGYLFLLKKQLRDFSSVQSIAQKMGMLGNWQIFLKKDTQDLQENTGWEALWKGEITCSLPNKKLELRAFSSLDLVQRKKLLKQWEKRKIPQFLRKKVPIICENGQIFRDLLYSKFEKSYTKGFFFALKINI